MSEGVIGALQHNNPFRDCQSIRQLLDQLVGAGSACWVESYGQDSDGFEIETVEACKTCGQATAVRVFASERAVMLSSYAMATLRNLIIRQGGWMPGDGVGGKINNATLADSFGGYEGKSIIERLIDDIDEAYADYRIINNKNERGELTGPDSDKAVAHTEGVAEGIAHALGTMRNSSTDHEWAEAQERFNSRNVAMTISESGAIDRIDVNEN